MKRIKRWFIISLIILSWILTFANIVINLKHKIVINLVSVFSSLIPLFVALYNEWDLIYEFINRLKMYFFNKTVKFQTEMKVNLEEECSLDKIDERIKKGISDSHFKIQDGMLKFHEFKMYNLTLENKKEHKGLIVNSRIDIQEEKLDIKFIFQISARNVTDIWDLAKKVNSKISDSFACKTIYAITLDYSASKLNPFYRLTLKTIGDKKNYKFDLEFKESDTQIKIHNNQLYATTHENMSELDKVIKEYISLATVI